GDLAAGGLDARNRFARALDHGRHVVGVGVNDRIGVAHDRDMALPENQVTPLELFRFYPLQGSTEPDLLQIAVARAAGAGGIQRDLHETEAIDPEAGLAAPEVGRTDELFGHAHEIADMAADRADVLPRQIPALAGHCERTLFAQHRN